ncbi:PA14 domain-containing protein [Dyadobacter jejuensis]|nr:PA14 domain-containing protein [Dyadobacter jejuensis]
MAIPVLAMAQTETYEPIPLSDLSAFEQPAANWMLQESMTVLPMPKAKPKFQKGAGILVGTPGTELHTKVKAKDLKLSLDFMVTPGASAILTLPGGGEVVLSDSYKQQQLDRHTSGYSGLFPTQNAAKAPGLWQHLELAYDGQVDNLPKSVRLNTLKLNGVTVLEAVYLPKTQDISTAGSSLSLKVNQGTMAFKNLGYQLLKNQQPLSLTGLSYKVYGEKATLSDLKDPVKEGVSELLTQEVTDGMKNFILLYTGTVEVKEAGEYTFSSQYDGSTFILEIDGQEVINGGGSNSQNSITGSVTLPKGNHPLKIIYSRFPWRAGSLGLMVSKPGIRAYHLHALSSLPIPPPKPYIQVDADEEPAMVRSFIQLPYEKTKRTKCISVGSPQGWNYSMDLEKGALIQAWRGAFADVTEMWYQRGEPQLLEPAGLNLLLTGKSTVASLENQQAAWPDSSNIDYLGYNIDNAGYPVYRFTVDGHPITDKLTSTTNGLERTITAPKANSLSVLLTRADTITAIGKGLYQVDGQYYIQIDSKLKPIIRKSVDKQELILPLNGQVQYTLIW